MGAPLPDFVPPMLARSGKPFDSAEHFFEVKWDGIRALAFAEGGSYRLLSRNQNDLLPRYPELGFLAGLPDGTLLDGELVVLRDGRPSFHAVLTREQARGALRIQGLARERPVTYVVFDVLYAGGAAVTDRTLMERREILGELVAAADEPALVFSDGIAGDGLTFFDQVREMKFEGMLAKRMTSPYRPGQRTDDWTKVKEKQILHCLILGYLAEGKDLRSLIIATEDDGELRSVGRVGSGRTDALRARLYELCRERERDAPLVECPDNGNWIEPGLYCKVSFLERTETGNLRAPVFLELIVE